MLGFESHLVEVECINHELDKIHVHGMAVFRIHGYPADGTTRSIVFQLYIYFAFSSGTEMLA
jgi:hypothetical protein